MNWSKYNMSLTKARIIAAFVTSAAFASLCAPSAWSQTEPKYKANVPPSVTTPDTVETRIGTLKFHDGLPDEETVRKVYDNLDFVRGVEAFLLGMPAANTQGLRRGFIEAGFPPNQGFGISESLADAGALFLTPNTVVVYTWAIIDVKDGPMVLQVPPGVLGILDDAYWRWVNDLGLTGPDQGKGGKYLVVPPDYKGELPKEGYFIAKTRTYSNVVIMRAFIQGSDVATIVKNVKANAAMYPLSAAANPPKPKFVNISGKQMNTVHSNDVTFFDELNEVVQHEPDDFLDPDVVGIFASIGIKKGKPFAPDARMKAILTDAAAVANATARAMTFASRDPLTEGLARPAVEHLLHAPATTSSPMAASGRWMRAPCPSTTSPACRRRWPARSWARARRTCTPSVIPRARTSTAARTTRSRCRPTFRRSGSGRSTSMTTSTVRSSRQTRRLRRSR